MPRGDWFRKFEYQMRTNVRRNVLNITSQFSPISQESISQCLLVKIHDLSVMKRNDIRHKFLSIDYSNETCFKITTILKYSLFQPHAI